MPIYHFHIEDGRSVPDHDGTELADSASAKLEAVRLAGALFRDRPADVWRECPWRLTVTDATDTPLFRLVFSAEALLPA